jgi:hypothetical protein
MHPAQAYRVILVAPNIPEYRRLALEEYGIRCVEVRPQKEHEIEATVAAEGALIRSAVRKAPVVVIEAFGTDRLSFHLFLPPCNSDALRLSHRLLVDSLPDIEREFSRFEIMPVSMRHANHQDMLCLRDETGKIEYVRPGVWWAYAFGASEHMPKNDKPNISVNAYPWGLDLAVNAELKTSQRVVLDRVTNARSRFDELRVEHTALELQLWMKLEQQPRFYHWVPLERYLADKWDGARLLERTAALRQQYPVLRKQWLGEIFANQSSLTDRQRAHMERGNQELNLAIRFVQTFRPEDEMWQQSFEDQLERINSRYRALKPLIEFFH